MKRREALKNIGLTSAFFAVTPTVINLLQSCTADVKSWIPVFLSKEQGTALTIFSDIILPKTKGLPSASELNIPEFIDKYILEVFTEENQIHFNTALNHIIHLLKPSETSSIEEVKIENYKVLLNEYLLTKDEIDQEREAKPEALGFTTSEFLNTLKSMTINAYRTSEFIGEQVLAYDPIPGTFYCSDLEELTNGFSWSL
ncbi:gluconate 2-dehydrogenase subunit 3 family protein [Aestuariibaculum sediminum]|uniref:Gluconate 2-dehydrogenase subunit 3 family protein n=1 Tax=Aestuariibaculum sediminum TaxID=2770637 RepID=A0A8J6Q405_9FLAO|nr:gluconate 2-dehydrogenase subunit 3 family protein [Aestuariibaculum sediminum]MBD0832945.1 gluconate 2-dehydrogenase subunit 3 family protein [Aestuariibaculum sediminum]